MTRTPPMVTLRALREAYGLTLEQLGERIGEQGVKVPSVGTLSNVELGRKPAGKRLASAWARALRLEDVDIYQAHDLAALLNSRTNRSAS